MAQYNTKTQKKDPRTEEYEYKYKSDYEADWSIHRDYITSFDPYEAMLSGMVYDSVSKSIDGSKITDSYAATLAIERAARVMGKLPDGKTEAVGKIDVGKAAFMDILRQKWIYPNANAQHNFDTKLRLWQLYSTVYGYMPMFYDWNVSNTGYVGPDCWLWNPRNLVPQQGRTSIEDMDYVTALTWVSKKYLQGILDDITESDDGDENKSTQGGWNSDALKLLIEIAENERTDADQEKDTLLSRNRTPQATRKGICLATRYEAGEDGEWCTFAPDHSHLEVRKIKNPHKNGRIPFVIKYSQPLFDSFYGMGDFQRAMPLQFARDGLTNFYFKGIKMNLIPPIVANANGIMEHTLDYREGAVMLETIPNSIRRLETSPAGLSTYQGAQSNLTGSLLSLFGSQNASIPGADTLNPSQGKTPAAIDLYSGKEADRDGQERMYLEGAIEQLTDGFFSLVANIGTEDIPVNLFSKDIEEIVKSGYKDVMGLFTVNKVTGEQVIGSKMFKPDGTMTAGQLTVKPDALKGVEYKFNIDANSTAKLSQQKQVQDLENLIGMLGKYQNIFKDDPRIQINWAKIMEVYDSISDIPGSSEFVTVTDGPSPQELQQQQQQAELQAQQSQTQVQSPSGQVHESADLTKLYLGTTDEGLKVQIIQSMGFQPTPAQPEPISNSGGVFHDPVVAAGAEEISKM